MPFPASCQKGGEIREAEHNAEGLGILKITSLPVLLAEMLIVWFVIMPVVVDEVQTMKAYRQLHTSNEVIRTEGGQATLCNSNHSARQNVSSP